MAAHPAHSERPGPITATKLGPPVPPAGFVARPALLERLVDRPSPVVLMTAPAGWGKSTLLAAWLAVETRPFAYLRLGPEDDDPRSFWNCVVSALRRVDESYCPGVDELLARDGIDPVRSLLPMVINCLHDRGDSLVLALDDYHVIADESIHGAVGYLIDHAPHRLQLAIATRADPPFGLARLRAAGALSEIRAADLRLSVDDTRQLLRARFGVDVDRSLTEALWARTEGWPAGIQLAGLSLAADSDPARFITSFAGDDRNVADYLTSEVLDRQPEGRRAFLLQTSVLDELNAELCDHVLRTEGSGMALEGLEHENLFLVPLDSRREWFRYHHLFRDWLRHRYRITADAGCRAELHRRAAEWLLGHALAERAVGHLLEAGEVAAAAETMEAILRRRPFITHVPIRRWIDALPDEVAGRHPALCMAHVSRALGQGDLEAAGRWLGSLEASLGAIEDAAVRRSLSSQAHVYRAHYSLVAGDVHAAQRDLQAVVDGGGFDGSTASAYARGLLGITLLWTTGAEAAVDHLREGARARRRLSLVDDGVTAHLAAARAELGQWKAAEEAAGDAFGLPEAEGSDFPATMAAHYAMGMVLGHRGRRRAARHAVQRGLDLARAWVQPGLVAWGCVVMAEMEGDPVEARRLLNEAEMLLDRRDRSSKVRRRLERARRRLERRAPAVGRGSTAVIVEPLTRRELDVLRLFRGDLSLPEIANELYISHNTAKGHAKAIYHKLGVNCRADAVAAATSAGVL